MRRLLCYIIMWIGIVGTMSGQIREAHPSIFAKTGSYHFAYVSGAAGYGSLHSAVPEMAVRGNWGGAFGFGYEFRNNGLWCSAGIQLTIHQPSLDVAAARYDYKGYDTQGKAATFHYDVTQQDNLTWANVGVPIMVGYYWHGLYGGLGVKASYYLRAQTSTKGAYTLSATNDDYGITFENMPEYGYTTYKTNVTEQNRLSFGVDLIGEVGYDLLTLAPFRKATCHVLKVGFYFEYGLNNVLQANPSPEARLEFTDASDATKAMVHPILNTYRQPERTVPYLVGLKITYMIGGNSYNRSNSLHTGCGCYE